MKNKTTIMGKSFKDEFTFGSFVSILLLLWFHPFNNEKVFQGWWLDEIGFQFSALPRRISFSVLLLQKGWCVFGWGPKGQEEMNGLNWRNLFIVMGTAQKGFISPVIKYHCGDSREKSNLKESVVTDRCMFIDE